MDDLGNKSKSDLISMVIRLKDEVKKYKAQSNIADRILFERQQYRDAVSIFCERCGIESAAKNNNRCEVCQRQRLDMGCIEIWKNESIEDWRGICKLIPPLMFPADWQVKIMMPFVGAAARFLAKKNNIILSVYFDAFDRLRYVGKPYWELYPGIKGAPSRFVAGEEGDLIKTMEKIFNSHKTNMKALFDDKYFEADDE